MRTWQRTNLDRRCGACGVIQKAGTVMRVLRSDSGAEWRLWRCAGCAGETAPELPIPRPRMPQERQTPVQTEFSSAQDLVADFKARSAGE